MIIIVIIIYLTKTNHTTWKLQRNKYEDKEVHQTKNINVNKYIALEK